MRNSEIIRQQNVCVYVCVREREIKVVFFSLIDNYVFVAVENALFDRRCWTTQTNSGKWHEKWKQ